MYGSLLPFRLGGMTVGTPLIMKHVNMEETRRSLEGMPRVLPEPTRKDRKPADTKQASPRQILTVDTNHARLLWEGQTLTGLTLLYHARSAQGNA